MRVNTFFALLFFFLVSCASQKSVEPVVDYSDERSILYEVSKARKMLDENPVLALARARALRDLSRPMEQIDSLYMDASASTRSEFFRAVDNGQWSDALRIYRSLTALSIAPTEWDEKSLFEKRMGQWREAGNSTLVSLNEVQRSTPEDEAPNPGIVSKMIKGTITVWVDRGLRVKNGVGFADRVIGSGFFIDKRGYLITNYHVISSEVDPKYEGYSRLFLKLPSDPDTRIPARVIGWDPVLDLALLKTEIEPSVVFQLGSSEDLKVGNRIYAIGSPAGLEQTLTSGIVSAQHRRLLSLGDILQIDAPINQGNSGGPIVDEAGRVQAVVFAGIEPFEGLNFAIPVELLRIILPALYDGGKVSHPWLGAWGKTAGAPGASFTEGVSVVYTIPGGPCYLAGIPPDAVITAINGQTVKNLEQFQSFIIREKPGTIVRLTGYVGEDERGERVDRQWYVMMTDRPEIPGQEIFERDEQIAALLPVFGMKLDRIGSSRRYTISALVRGGIADESGFSENDVVEIRDIQFPKDKNIVTLQLFTKRRSKGYLEAYIGLGASLDSPSYF